MVKAVTKRAGIKRSIGNHTLRRSCGRLMYYSGVPLVEIAEAFGLSDVKVTIRYLGLTVDDLRKAQEKTFSYLNQVRRSMSAVYVEKPMIRIRD